jgi:hypothetical protein
VEAEGRQRRCGQALTRDLDLARAPDELRCRRAGLDRDGRGLDVAAQVEGGVQLQLEDREGGRRLPQRLVIEFNDGTRRSADLLK